MKKFILFILGIITLLFVVGCINKNVKHNYPITRDVSLISEQIDYQSFFNDFTKQEVILDKKNNTIQFKATKEIDSYLFEEIDFINYSENKNKVEFDYDVKYDANSNVFFLSITANVIDGKVIDNWKGIPFIDYEDKVDIAFSTDDGIIYLSDLENKEIINECGWFSRLFRKIATVVAVVAVVTAVVAVAVVAAPVAAAAGTAFVTAISSGGIAALTASGAAVAMATAATTAVAGTAFLVASTTFLAATTTALISKGVSNIADVIEYHNSKVIEKEKWTSADLEKILALATVVLERGKNRDTVIYLGRIKDCENVFKNDEINNIIRFYLPFEKWEELENKYTIEGMWILNRAFIDFGIFGEKTKNWKFRLATNHYDYPIPRLPGRDGYYYSMELDHLRKTSHIFSPNLTKHGYYEVYAI